MRIKCALVGLVVLSFTLASPPPGNAASKYRKALKNYWEKQLKEEGVSPLFYGSTIHTPKTVWTKTGGVYDFYGSGLDLYPENLLPVLKGDISLPDIAKDREVAISVGLQLAGIKDVADVDLNALVNSKTSWRIAAEAAEMHFLAKRDARRCNRLFTGPILADYFTDLQPGERLFVVLKAVFISEPTIEVTGSFEVGGEVGAEATGLLEKLGFKASSKKTLTASLKGTNRYFAVGFRELTESGLKSDAAVDGAPALLLEIPERYDPGW